MTLAGVSLMSSKVSSGANPIVVPLEPAFSPDIDEYTGVIPASAVRLLISATKKPSTWFGTGDEDTSWGSVAFSNGTTSNLTKTEEDKPYIDGHPNLTESRNLSIQAGSTWATLTIRISKGSNQRDYVFHLTIETESND